MIESNVPVTKMMPWVLCLDIMSVSFELEGTREVQTEPMSPALKGSHLDCWL